MEIEYTRPFLYPYQLEILNTEARFSVTEAATKTGKTASHIVWLFEQALQGKDGQNFWWAAPVYGQAEIAFNRMRRQVTHPDFFKVNESKLRLTLPSGSIITFKTAEKPDNLYGDDVYAAVFDEFTRAKEAAWHALRSTLTATKGPCKFIGNVRGKANWGAKLAATAKNNDHGWAYFKITAYQAVEVGLLSAYEIADAKRELPESVFKELYLAEPADNASNPFGETFIEQCTYAMSALPAVVYGIDLAKSVDYTVIIGLDTNRQVCHFERFQRDWHSTKNAIMALPRNTPKKIDSTGVGDPIVEDLQISGCNVEGFKFTSASKQQLLLGLVSSIQQRKITFPKGPITDELSVFEYLYTTRGVRYSAPDGFHDDCVMALALADQNYSGNHGGFLYSCA